MKRSGHPVCSFVEPLEARIVCAAGDFEASFGGGAGKVVTDYATRSLIESFHAVAVQADGKILAVGSVSDGGSRLSPDVALVRFNADGSPDLTFGNAGEVLFDLGGQGESEEEAFAMVVQPDGKIVVGGRAWYVASLTDSEPPRDYDALLARFNPDGSVDTSFGTSGHVLTDLGTTTDAIQGLALASNGAIVAVGSAGGDAIVARYSSAGALDPSFGAHGFVTTDFGGADTANAAAVQASDGRIVIAGSNGRDFALARYNTDGTLDMNFGTAGKVLTDFGSPSDVANALAIDSSGRILAGGSFLPTATASHFALARYSTAGTLDGTFGTGGLVTLDVDGALSGGEEITGVAVQADGKVVVAGTAPVTGQGGGLNFAAARFTDSGGLDTGYGNNGHTIVDFGGNSNDRLGGAALDASGRLVLVGTSRDFSVPLDSGHVSAARLEMNGLPDATFGDAGLVQFDVRAPAGNTGVAYALDGASIIVVGSAETTPENSLEGTHFTLTKYLADGTFDTAFGDGGKVLFDLGFFAETPSSIVIQADHKIIVGGSQYQDNGEAAPSGFPIFARFNADGTLDTSYGVNGLVRPAPETFQGFSQEGGVNALAVQPDGDLLVVENSANAFAGFHEMVVERYTSSGALDPSFGVHGRVVFDAHDDIPDQAVLLESDGKILLGGSTPDGVLLLARLDTTGALDPVFGDHGVVAMDFANSKDDFAGMVLEPDGSITVGAHATLGTALNNGATGVVELVRFSADGQLNQTFGIGGRTLGAGFGGGAFQVGAFAREADGKYFFSIMGGSAGTEVGRLTATGDFDITFGKNGLVPVGFGSALTQLSDGELLVVGTSIAGNFSGIAATGVNEDIGIAKLRTAPESSPNGVFSFSFATGLVSEGDPFATVTVLRTSGATGAVTVHYATTGGTASPTADYQPVSGDLQFADGETSKTFQIPLDNNLNGQPQLEIDLSLSAPTGGAVLDNPQTAVVFIAAHSGPLGSVDPNFGEDGNKGVGYSDHTLPVGTRNDSETVADMALQPDGKVVVAGYNGSFSEIGASGDFLLSRFNADGTPDLAFGSNGSVQTDFRVEQDTARSVIVLSDGKILVGGTVVVDQADTRDYGNGATFSGPTDFLGFARYNPDGSLDRTFGDNGEVLFTMPGREPDNRLGDMQSLPDGHFLVGISYSVQNPMASSSVLGGIATSGVLRFNADGTLDPTFGVAGFAATGASILDGAPKGANDAPASAIFELGALVVQPDGKIVCAGNQLADFNSDQHVKVVRFNADGSIDKTFGANGSVVADATAGNLSEEVRSVLVQSDGKIVVAGLSDGHGALLRFNANGTLDTGFHGTGAEIFSASVGFYGVAQLSNGKLVTVGTDAGGHRLAAEFLTDGTPDPLFGIQGASIVTQLGGGGLTSGGNMGGALLVQADNKILAAFGGQAANDSSANSKFALVRLITDPGSGVVNFSGSSEEVDETAGLAHVFVERTDGSNGAITVNYQTVDGTAHAGSHYTSVSGTLTFADGETEKEILVPILRDSVAGDTQSFTVTLSNPGGGVSVGAFSATTVTIDDGPGTLSFSSPQYNFLEGNQIVTVQVLRTGGTTGGVAVDYSLGGGTAVAGLDYDALSAGTLDFAAGQNVATITFALKNNPLNHGAETINLSLLSPLGGASLGLSHATVDIFELQPGAGNNAGGLDAAFGSGGTNLANPFASSSAQSFAAAVQKDGKVVVVGETGGVASDFAVVRYNQNGTLDTSFGTGGIVTTDFFGQDDSARSVVIQPDGKIVVAGWALNSGSGDFALARYNANGTLDPTFSQDGKATVDFGGLDDRASAVALGPDGKIVVAGWTLSPFVFDFAAARLNPDGSLDKTFDGDGKVTTDFSGRQDQANAVLVQPDGKIVLGGVSSHELAGQLTPVKDPALVRYNVDGTLDKTFSNGGLILGNATGPAVNASVTGMVLRPNGDIVAVGQQAGNIFLTEFASTGVILSTGSYNFATFGGSFSADQADAVALEPDGSLVIVGKTIYPTDFQDRLAILKVNPDLSLDVNFGLKGKVALAGFPEAHGVAVDGDGNIVTVGGAFETARFLGVSKAPPQGAFQLDQVTYSVDEAAGLLTVTVSRPHDANFGRVTVDYATIGLTAIPGADFTSVSGTLVFAESETTKSFSIPINNDTIAEGDEAFEVILANPTGGAELSSNSSATVVIPANDLQSGTGGFNFGPNGFSGGSASESSGFAFATVQRTGGSVGAITVDWATMDGTAKAGLDYTPQFGTLSFADGQTSAFLFFGGIIQDSEVEGAETFYVKFSSPTGGSTLGSGVLSTLPITITDSTPASTYVNASGPDPTFGTNGQVATDITGGGAPQAIAHQSDGKLVVVGNAGSTGGFSVVRYNPDGSLDSAFGKNGIATTDITAGPGYEGAYGVEILPNGEILVVGISDGTGVEEIVLAKYKSNGVLDTTFGKKGIALQPVLDFDLANYFRQEAAVITFQPDGKPLIGATVQNGIDSSMLLLRFDTNGMLDPTFGHGGGVTYDTGLGSAFFNSASSISVQGDGKLVVTNTSGTELLRFNASGLLDTTFGQNGVVQTPNLGTLFFPGDSGLIEAGSAQLSASLIQPDGKIVVFGSGFARSTDPASGDVVHLASGLAAIRYNADGTLDPTFGTGGVSIATGAYVSAPHGAALQSDGRLVISGEAAGGVGIERLLSDGRPDLSFGPNGFANILNGAAGETTAVLVQPDGHIVAAGGGSYDDSSKFYLARVVGGDATGEVRLNNAGLRVSEDGASVLVPIERLSGWDGPLTVTLATSDGSALAGMDYTAVSQTVSWANFEAGVKYVSIPIIDDQIAQGDLTFNITLENPTNGGGLHTQHSGTVTIIDDENAGQIEFSGASFSAAENAGATLITVHRIDGKGGPVDIDFSTVTDTTGGTAAPNIDYVPTAGTLHFDAGQTTATFAVTLLDNDVLNEDKTVVFSLSNPRGGAALGAVTSARLTIIDNEVPQGGVFDLGAARAEVSESGGGVLVTIDRIGGSAGEAKVKITAGGGSAIAGHDYLPFSSVLDFQPGETEKTLFLPVFNDSIVEGDRTVLVSLSDPTGTQVMTTATTPTIGEVGTETVTIHDDDARVLTSFPGSFTLLGSSVKASEHSGSAAIVVVRNGGHDGAASVDLVLADGTAVAGRDYTGTTIHVSFADGQLSQTVQVPIRNDFLAEPNETFTATLRDPSNGASLGAATSATVTILDDDYSPLQDFNHDGNRDLVVIKHGKLNLLLGDGSGGFGKLDPIGSISAPGSFLAGDFNGDGNMDLVVFSSLHRKLALVEGNGDGTFQAPFQFSSAKTAKGLTFGDFNGDGALDLAAIQPKGINVFFNEGDGKFAAPVIIGSVKGISKLLAGDFNGDGALDLAAMRAGVHPTVNLLAGNGFGSFAAPVTSSLPRGTRLPVAGDFSGDGVLDLAALEPHNRIGIFDSDGDGRFSAPALSATTKGAQFLGFGDFNDDLHLDLLTINAHRIASVLVNQGGVLADPMPFGTSFTPKFFAICDLNHDDDPDLLLYTASGTFKVLFGAPGPGFQG